MTNEEINKAIAEASGWKPQTLCTDYNGVPWPDEPPNYCNDLNAMHRAENISFRHTTMWETFVDNILNDQPLVGVLDSFIIVARTTARQRAVAFLKTLGKWEVETK